MCKKGTGYLSLTVLFSGCCIYDFTFKTNKPHFKAGVGGVNNFTGSVKQLRQPSKTHVLREKSNSLQSELSLLQLSIILSYADKATN